MATLELSESYARPLDPEITQVGLHPSGQFEESHIAIDTFKHNRAELAKYLEVPYEAVRYTPPAMPHYPHQYEHDSFYIAEAMARDGNDESFEMAEKELYSLADAQKIIGDGSIPNMIFANKGRRFDLERQLVFGINSPYSRYMQPADFARAVAEVYQGQLDQLYRDPDADLKALSFLENIYDAPKQLLDHWDEKRTNGQFDKLKFIIIPQEHGRDSCPSTDKPIKKLLPEFGENTLPIIRCINSPLEYAQLTLHGMWLARHNWDLDKAKQKFAPKDVMMNCMDVANRFVMADLAESLGKSSDAKKFRDQALEVEDQILNRMYFPDENDGEGVFWSLDKNNRPIRELTISSLYPLLLPNLEHQHLKSLQKVMDRHFNTQLPFPTVATTSRKFDPYNKTIDRLSRGPTWMHHNRQIHDYGIVGHIKRLIRSGDDPVLARSLIQIASKLRRQSLHALHTEGAYEHFNPITGKGQRPRVGNNFAWSRTAHVMLPESTYTSSF